MAEGSMGKRLQLLRHERALTQKELSNILDVSQTTVAMLENDKREPGCGMLIKLADLYNVTIDYIVGRVENRDVLVHSLIHNGEKYNIKLDSKVFPDGMKYDEVINKLEVIKKLEASGIELTVKNCKKSKKKCL